MKANSVARKLAFKITFGIIAKSFSNFRKIRLIRAHLLLSIILLLNSSWSSGQGDIKTLNGYKYVFVEPIKYQDGSYDKFALMSYCDKQFSELGFELLNINNLPPIDKVNKACLTLYCYITHTGNYYGKNSLTLLLKNCNDETVYEKEVHANGVTWVGESTIAKVLDKCIKKAFEPLNKLNYSFDAKLTPGPGNIHLEYTGESEDSLKKYFNDNLLNDVEGIFKSVPNEEQTYYKVAIKKYYDIYKVIVLESNLEAWKAGEVKAYLEPSSTEGVFSAKWYKANKKPQESILTLENGGFYIFLTNSADGKERKDAFLKMYPHSDVSNKESAVVKTGSGFFISPEGIIATNAHVVSGTKKITISVRDESGNNTYDAKVLLSDSKNDVAILKIDDSKFKIISSLPYGVNENPEIGEKVFTIGYPLNTVMGENYKVTDGIISSKSGINDDVRYLQISVPLQPGNSGGPLFNKQGNIVGITSARLNSSAVGTQVENVNYAIKISYLLTLFYMLPNSSRMNEGGTLGGKELTDQIKILKNFVCLVEAR